MKSIKLDARMWAQETFGGAQLGDPRRTRRLVTLAAQMVEDPEGSLPRQTQGNWGDLKAAYRLLRADGVTHEAISQSSWQQSRSLVEPEAEVLLLHDDTELDYGYKSAREGLGSIGNGSHRGMLVHSVLAVVPVGAQERVLGMVAQEPWVREAAPRHGDGGKQTSRERRERPRESEVWWHAIEQVGRPRAGQRWIHVGDRYADMWPFLQTCEGMGVQFVVRAAHNRRLGPQPGEPNVAHLLDEARQRPAQADGEIAVASEHERRARQAQVRVSWGSVQLVPMDGHGRKVPGGQPIAVQVVRVWEPDPPTKAEGQRAHIPSNKHGKRRNASPASGESERMEPLEWILLTSLPVANAGHAWRIIGYYQARWTIEEFHRGLKSGCHLEWARLREEKSLENLLAICSPIAVHLLQLRDLARQHPEERATTWVTGEEAHVVATQANVSVEALTIRQYVRQVAHLGGFLGRSRDGEPGWQTLWQGWMRLHWFVAGMRFASSA